MICDTYVKGTKESEAGHLYPSNGGGARSTPRARRPPAPLVSRSTLRLLTVSMASTLRLNKNPDTFDGFGGLDPDTFDGFGGLNPET